MPATEYSVQNNSIVSIERQGLQLQALPFKLLLVCREIHLDFYWYSKMVGLGNCYALIGVVCCIKVLICVQYTLNRQVY